MLQLKDLPEHVLHIIISSSIDAARFKGWLLSLRLVNRDFNEAVLHVCFLQRRFFADASSHSLDCIHPCCRCFCRSNEVSRLKYAYAFRFSFQGLLTVRDLSDEVADSAPLLRQWEAALTILQRLEIPKQLDSDQLQFYSACTANPIFNEPCSAILSQAVGSYLDNTFLSAFTLKSAPLHDNQHTAFWVALAACVLGDLPLFEHCVDELPLPTEGFSNPVYSEGLPRTEHHLALSRVAAKHGSLPIVNLLLETFPNITSERSFDGVLRAAIFSENNQVLGAILRHTPNLPDLLTRSLYRYPNMLPQSESSSETIRLLAQHFTPLSAESRAWLIVHSCAVNDLSLLEDFSTTGPLFSYRIEHAGGRIPTYLDFAIRSGNVGNLRYLLAHGIAETRGPYLLCMQIEQALYFNQIESYRELRRRLDSERLELSFASLALAENSGDILSESIPELISEYGKDLIFDPREDLGRLMPSPAQRALVNAIQRLRTGNVQVLLSVGARVSPGQFSDKRVWDLAEEPFEISWPYFNQNRDAFQRTQEVLDTFGMANLRVLV